MTKHLAHSLQHLHNMSLSNRAACARGALHVILQPWESAIHEATFYRPQWPAGSQI